MPVGFDNRHYTMKYRSRTQIITDILRVVNDSSTVGGGIKKTKIMYTALLSYEQIKQYLSLLTESDLLQYDKTTHTFNITQKGIRFLGIRDQIDQAIIINGSEAK